MDLIILLLGGLLVLWLANNFIKSRNRAPGPFRLPLIGTLHAVLKNGRRHKPPFQLLQELSATYGPVMSLKIGLVEQGTYLVVTDFELMKQVLTSDLWIDRYKDPYILERSGGKSLGIIFINGEVWKEMRRFTTRTLRDFGFGRQKSMESVISEELEDLKCRLNLTLQKTKNTDIPLKQFFTVSVLNILWSMIAGHRFSHDNERLLELIDLIDTMSKAFPITASIVTAYPFLRFFHRRLTSVGRARVAFRDKIQNFFRQLLLERRRLGLYQNVQKDFVDVFLNEIDRHNKENSDNNFYTDEQFILVTLDLFLAGSETTSNTLEFAFLRMMLHPQVQAKVQNEIDTVVGHQRLPTTSDRAMMPYTDAVLLEIQRLSNVIPMIVRSPTEDTKIGPYHVPKGVLCVSNTYAWHMDEKYWSEPLQFRPERFLDDNGACVINAHKILPFGSGKRVCLGEVLAKATIFTYFTTLLQSYTFEVSPHHPRPTAQPDVGFTLSPHPYFAKIIPRKP